MKIQAYGCTVDLSKHDAGQLNSFITGLVDDIEHYSNYHLNKDYDEAKEAFEAALEYILYCRK